MAIACAKRGEDRGSGSTIDHREDIEGTYTEGELKGMTVLGILQEIDSNNMRGCFALPSGRPTEFSLQTG